MIVVADGAGDAAGEEAVRGERHVGLGALGGEHLLGAWVWGVGQAQVEVKGRRGRRCRRGGRAWGSAG